MPKLEFRVYISSTLEDLKEERLAAQLVIGKLGLPDDSYRASEKATVQKCIDDVHAADLYVGILGHRYGWVPDGEEKADAKSITEMEYDACRTPGMRQIPRLIFMRTLSPQKYHDVYTHAATADRIKSFRARAAAEQNPYEFEDVAGLKFALLDTVRTKKEEFHRSRSPQSATFDPLSHWPTNLRPVSLLYVPGNDEPIVNALTAKRSDPFGSVPVKAQDPNPAKIVESAVQAAQVCCLVVTAASLPRMTDAASIARFDFVLETLARRGAFGAVIRVGVPVNALPAAWQALPSLELDTDALAKSPASTVDQLFAALRGLVFPEPTMLPRVALPLIVIAPTKDNVKALLKPGGRAFDGFKELAKARRDQFNALVKAARARQKPWPDGFYGATSADWHCFGPNGPRATTLIERAVTAINEAPDASRARRAMRQTRIVLRRYDLDEYLNDRHGSRDALQAVAGNALVCLDETALFDAKLREAAKTLLTTARGAIVSISPCDPAHVPMRDLLSETSFLLNALVSRFHAEFDPQCELSLNSEGRLLRWLRSAIPELLRDLAGHGGPRFVNDVDDLLE